MTARTFVLLGILLIVAGAGLVWLRGAPSAPEPIAFPHAARQRPPRRSADRDGPVVAPAGVMINGPVHTGDDPAEGASFGVDLAFFGSFERTRLALELFYPDGGLIDVDREQSSLALFEDDRGTSLAPDGGSDAAFEMLPRVSKDRRYLVFVLPSEKLPSPKATRLRAKGVAVIQVASSKAVFDAPDVALAAGTRFTAGGYDFAITEAGLSPYGEGTALTLQTDRDTASIIRYALVGANGAETPLSPSMSMSGMGSWTQTLEAKRDLPTEGGRVTFRLECWQDVRTVEVPFDVETSLGLR